MARKKRNRYPLYENVEIIDLAIEGKAVGKVKNNKPELPDLTIFVSKTVPGDIVDVQINKKKKNYKEGYPVKFRKYSDKRIDPACRHFGVCGGCTRQQLAYEEQLKYKQKQTEETLKRIAKINLPEINKIMPAPDIFFYRNKLEFSFSDARWLTEDEINSGNEIKNFKALGFHIPGRFDKILDIEECLLQKEPSNKIRLFVKEFAIKHNYDFFNLYKKEGFLRNMIIRTSETGEIMVIISFAENDKEKIHKLLDALTEKFPEITSANYVINGKLNDSISDLKVINYKGKDHILEKMDDIKYIVGPKSFYQTNSKQAKNLYLKTKEFAGFEGHETVYDLYTGTGTIANFIAGNVKKVIGLEYVEEAVEDAVKNSKINNITNTEFYAGDIKDLLTRNFFEKHGKPDIIISDPPRAGMHKNVLNAILEAEPEKIVYISCNIATQARDIQILSKKYEAIKIQPVDMFPHTHHIENIIMLKNKMLLTDKTV
ncbi:MAG: 23S rRNA (uracil(1939)-C(5))-methyltransferase RlmD [Chlorobi bacterium]|nr:23S rRNA (uracil(1939)-C(5))-methyltransferase RlmD [Chlorobiota bacterium]